MTLFERFTNDPEHRVRGLIAYGLYKAAKREWVDDFTERAGTPPAAIDVATYTSTWTPLMVAGKISEANQVLQEFADTIIAAERPAIIEAALRGSTARTVLLNVVSAFLYTLILIGVVVVLRYAGVDLLALAGTVH